MLALSMGDFDMKKQMESKIWAQLAVPQFNEDFKRTNRLQAATIAIKVYWGTQHQFQVYCFTTYVVLEHSNLCLISCTVRHVSLWSYTCSLNMHGPGIKRKVAISQGRSRFPQQVYFPKFVVYILQIYLFMSC